MRVLLALAALLLAVLAPVAEAAKRKPLPGPVPPLSHHERFFTDSTGRAVFLHGFNMVFKVGSYRPEDAGFGRDDARFLRRHGFNTIRLGVICAGSRRSPSARPSRRRLGWVSRNLKSQ